MRGECVPAHAGRRLHFEGVTDLVRLLSAGGKHLRSVDAPIMKTGSMRAHTRVRSGAKEGWAAFLGLYSDIASAQVALCDKKSSRQGQP